MVNEKILNDVKVFIEQIKSEINIQSVYLFGSYAKATNEAFSDIDVAIISDSFEGFLFSDTEKILSKTKNINRMIEAHPFRKEDFTEDNPLVKEIIRSGIKIY